MKSGKLNSFHDQTIKSNGPDIKVGETLDPSKNASQKQEVTTQTLESAFTSPE